MFGHKKKKIGLLSASGFAIGMMVGAGVFVLSGKAINQAGPAAIGSFILAGVIVLLSALCLVYVVQSGRKSAVGYDAVGGIFSPIAVLIVSWCFYVSAVFGAVFVLDAFGTYLHQFLLPHSNSMVAAIIALLVLVIINLISPRAVGRVENILVSAKLLVLICFVGFGLAALAPHDLAPFAPHGVGAMFGTSTTLFIAFLGFSTITSISGELENPKKTIPRAMIISMGVVTLLYVGVCLAMLSAGLSTYTEASVGVAAAKLMGPVGGLLVVIGALIATLSAANASILSSSELMLRLADRKYVPTVLARQYRGHPLVSLVIVTVAVCVLLISANIDTIIDIANVAAISGLVVVDLAAIKLAITRKARLWCVGAVAATIGVVYQLILIPPRHVQWGAGVIFIGILLYGVRELFYIRGQHKQISKSVAHGETPLLRRLSRRK